MLDTMRYHHVALAVLMAGCTPENDIKVLYPDIAVSPQSLDFGDVIVEYDSTLPISILNSGRAPLTVSDVSFDGSRSGAFTIGDDALTIDAGEVGAVDITFKPLTYLPYTDTIIVHSDAPDEEEVTVRLFGEGVDGPVPDIDVNGLSFEFDEVYINTTDYQIFEVINAGEGDLVIDTAVIEGSDLFELLDPLDGQTISGGSTFSTALGYTPDDEEGESATLTITSNDPDESPLVVTLLGNGGGAFAYPVADFDCPTDVATLDNLRFDGSESYDPNGNEPLDFFWTLTQRPDGSESELAADGERAELLVDIAGHYTVQLLVENTVGIYSEIKSCTFEAIPADQIHVELVWNTNDSDLDLHLVRSGSEVYDVPGDACYCNQEPDWGVSGEKTDDASLDLDDQWGMGPENINIEVPVEDEYTVYVHYYRDNGGRDTTATVRIYLYGELLDELYGLVNEYDLWKVGVISWPDGTFTPAGEDMTELDSGLCSRTE